MQLPVADARERTRTSENMRNIKKKVAGSDSFINSTLNYLLHFTCVCVGMVYVVNGTETTCGKDNETTRTIKAIG
jgi:hypothetical protein